VGRELLLAIDPGKVTGLALFRRGRLVAANAADGDTLWTLRPPCTVDQVIVERPCARMSDRGVRKINDLLALAIRAGRAAAPFGDSVTWIRPEGWKGELPKNVAAGRYLKCLDPEELLLVPDDHNVRDAIGLGLYALGRWRT
jgi:hypothetical protein